MIKHIAIITGQHLVSNPRVWKEANLLHEAGYKVSIFTTWYSSQKLQQDYSLINRGVNYRSSFNLIPSLKSFPAIVYAKAIKRFANLAFQFFKIATIYQELYLPRTQLKNISKYQFDLYICHQEAGLIIGNKLVKNGHRVAFDFEDYYSEDYINKYRPVSLLKQLESSALKNALFLTCPSETMARVIPKDYGIQTPIEVVYNSFPLHGVEYADDKIPNSFLWFSQTIGPGRGIEQFIKALKKLESSVEVHFVGNISDVYKQFLFQEMLGSNHNIRIMPLLSHADLLHYISRFEVGLALELDIPANKNITISNKILLYLQMNLKVVASKTLGQLELQPNFSEQISYVDVNNTEAFSSILNTIIQASSNRMVFDTDNKFSWEKTGGKIVKLVESSLQQ